MATGLAKDGPGTTRERSVGTDRPTRPSHLLGCLAIAADQFGLGLISPLLPFRVDSALEVGVVLTAQYVAVVAGQLLVGALSDVIGRRTCLVIVMGMDAVLFGLTAWAEGIIFLVLVRTAVGLFAPISLAVSWVADVSSGLPRATYRRNFAHVGLSFNLGALLGSAAGGILGPANWLAANLISAAPALAAAAWAVLSPDSAPMVATGPREVEGVLATVRHPAYLASLFQYLQAGALLGSFYSLAPVILKERHGASALDIAALMLASALWNIFNNAVVVGPLLGLLGAHRHVVLCSLVAAGSNAVLAAAGSSSAIVAYGVLPVWYVGGALSLTVLNMMSSQYALRFGKNAVGTVNGVSRAVFSTGFGIAPLLSISLYSDGAPWAPFATAAAFWVLAASCTAAVALWGDPDPVPGRLSGMGKGALRERPGPSSTLAADSAPTGTAVVTAPSRGPPREE